MRHIEPIKYASGGVIICSKFVVKHSWQRLIVSLVMQSPLPGHEVSMVLLNVNACIV